MAARKWAEDCPDSPKPLDKLGELLARQGDYKGAFEAAQEGRARGAKSDWTSDLLASVGRAYFDRQWATRAMQDALDAHPEIGELAIELLSEYWPTYRRLGPESQARWLRAVVLWRYRQLDRLWGSRCQAEVALNLAVTVETEIRARVFEPFRMLESSRQLTDYDFQNHSKLSSYVDGGDITLGEMMNCVTAQAKSPVGTAFSQWVTKNCPTLRQYLSKMGRDRVREFVDLRNKPLHGSVIADEQLVVLHDSAREVLNALFA